MMLSFQENGKEGFAVESGVDSSSSTVNHLMWYLTAEVHLLIFAFVHLVENLLRCNLDLVSPFQISEMHAELN